jgi:diguanylate cyclase (GGDEF)-like protein
MDGLKGSLARSERALKRMRVTAAADTLTGLANQRTFHKRLDVEVERAQRYGRALSVACVDVDASRT